MKILIDIEGYKKEAEYKVLHSGDIYISDNNILTATEKEEEDPNEYIVLEKVKEEPSEEKKVVDSIGDDFSISPISDDEMNALMPNMPNDDVFDKVADALNDPDTFKDIKIPSIEDMGLTGKEDSNKNFNVENLIKHIREKYKNIDNLSLDLTSLLTLLEIEKQSELINRNEAIKVLNNRKIKTVSENHHSTFNCALDVAIILINKISGVNINQEINELKKECDRLRYSELAKINHIKELERLKDK
jgi:hypothetical protein